MKGRPKQTGQEDAFSKALGAERCWHPASAIERTFTTRMVSYDEMAKVLNELFVANLEALFPGAVDVSGARFKVEDE